jgi:hypothetical protein
MYTKQSLLERLKKKSTMVAAASANDESDDDKSPIARKIYN